MVTNALVSSSTTSLIDQEILGIFIIFGSTKATPFLSPSTARYFVHLTCCCGTEPFRVLNWLTSIRCGGKS